MRARQTSARAPDSFGQQAGAPGSSQDLQLSERPQSTSHSRDHSYDLDIHVRAESSDGNSYPTPPSQESYHGGLAAQQQQPAGMHFKASKEPLIDGAPGSPQSVSHRRYPESRDSYASSSQHPAVRNLRNSFQNNTANRDSRGSRRSDYIDVATPEPDHTTADDEDQDVAWAAEGKSHQILQVEGDGWSGKGDLMLDDKGRTMRRYKLHPGSNKFFLRGRILTSRDSIWTFVGTLTVALVLPIGFLVFNAEWLWNDWQGGAGGGKAVVILFAYLALMMLVNMLRASCSDPGICSFSFPFLKSKYC